MRMLFMAHSGLRYLVLLVGVIALAYFAYSAVTRKGDPRTSRILSSAYAGVVDLQILLGMLMIIFGIFYSALIGHVFMMIAAAAVAHGASVMARGTPNLSRGNAIRLMGVAVSLILIVGGIMAIGRSVFGTGAPTLMS